MEKLERMRALIEILNQANVEYYQKNHEMMSNPEYDKLYDELAELEEETGILLGNSPTQNVGAQVLSELPKRTHEYPMLSLDKTKSVEDLGNWLGEQSAMLSWKLDGLTIVLTYRDGMLASAVTRGNGSVGEEITPNAKAFSNIPLKIPFRGELVLRGEAVIKYSDFEKINAKIPDAGAKYKNPRNLCSGTVRQLNTAMTRERNVCFFAFGLVRAKGMEFALHHEEMDWLKHLGFAIVDYRLSTIRNLGERIAGFQSEVGHFDIPSDGLVLLMDDIAYGRELGSTAKFPRNAMAFKWSDEEKETKLIKLEWSPSRTGLINPVAIFEPVDLEGTTVSRASVHNVSIVEGLELGEGDILTVYKANMIIPQIADNLTRSNRIEIPGQCPACGGPTSIKNENGVKTLYCTNADCPVKQLKSFGHMVSRDALNIDGLSEMTLEKFLAKGFLHRKSDIFELAKHREEITDMEGFGQKSYENLIAAIEVSRKTTMARFVYALGITGIGQANAKAIAGHFRQNMRDFMKADTSELQNIEGIGAVLAGAITDYFQNPKNEEEVLALLSKVSMEEQKRDSEPNAQSLAGKVFVITGSLAHFANRGDLEEKIESLGGRTSSSVSKKTSYLINNDTASASGKNKKAMELGIEIISEEDFLAMIDKK